MALHVPEPLPAVQARLGAARDVGPRSGPRGRRPRRGRRLGRRPRPPGARRPTLPRRRRTRSPPPPSDPTPAIVATATGPATNASPACATAWPSSIAGSTIASARASPTPRWPATPRGTRWRPASSMPGPAPSPTGCAGWPAWSAPGPTGTSTCWPSWACCTCSPRPASASPSCLLELADAVATACGWQVRQADVLAGVPDTDTWVVAGRSDTRGGPHRGAPDLAARPEQRALGDDPLVRRLPPVARQLAAPSARRSTPTCTATPASGCAPSSAPCTRTSPPDVVCSPPAAHRRRRLRRRSAGPWSPSRGPTICRRRCGRRSRGPAAGGCSATTPAALPLAPEAPGLAVVLAASAGAPVDVTVEWTVDGVRTAHRPPRTTACSTSARAPICPS